MARPGRRLNPAADAVATSSSRLNRVRGPIAGPTVFGVVAVAIVAATGVRGSDYPAHVFRAVEWRANPMGTWNFQWYGGHSTFVYSVLSPPLAALLSPFWLCAATSLATIPLAGRLMRRFVGPTATTAGTLTLALVALDDVIVGRVPFALGYMLLVATLLLWARRRVVVAGVVAVGVGFASPVAAVMLGLVVGAIVIDQAISANGSLLAKLGAARHALAIGGATALPLIVMAIVTARTASASGYFPFIAINIVFSVAVATIVVMTARQRVVRIGAAIALAVTVAAAVVPNPLGGNLSRLTAYVMVPLATALFVDRGAQSRATVRSAGRRWSPTIVAASALWLVTVGFAVSFSARTTYRWYHDPSHESAYFEPLIDEVQRWQADRPLTRIEIPFTQGHMEAAVVAPDLPYARGWERQVDLHRNAVLYDEALSADQYRAWLDAMGVGLIAVPDAPLDGGGKPEVALIDSGLDWLTPVWEGEHWRLYAVDRPAPLATGGRVTAIDANGITVDVDAPGEVAIAAVYDQRLAITPTGCLRPDDSGMMIADVARPGEYHIGERGWAFLVGSGTRCRPGD